MISRRTVSQIDGSRAGRSRREGGHKGRRRLLSAITRAACHLYGRSLSPSAGVSDGLTALRSFSALRRAPTSPWRSRLRASRRARLPPEPRRATPSGHEGYNRAKAEWHGPARSAHSIVHCAGMPWRSACIAGPWRSLRRVCTARARFLLTANTPGLRTVRDDPTGDGGRRRGSSADPGEGIQGSSDGYIAMDQEDGSDHERHEAVGEEKQECWRLPEEVGVGREAAGG